MNKNCQVNWAVVCMSIKDGHLHTLIPMPIAPKVLRIWPTATFHYASFPLVASKDTCRHIADHVTLPGSPKLQIQCLFGSPTLGGVNP